MRIAMIGTGYVGLVSGACFSEFGVSVTCVDNDADKIARLRNGVVPIYEPGLEALVGRNTAAGRLSFEVDISPAVREADAVFIAVGTPSRRGDGHADLSYVHGAAEEIADALDGYTIVVTKSTVPVGTGHEGAPHHRRARAVGRLRRRLQPRVPARRFGDRGFYAARPRHRRRRFRSAPARSCAPCTGLCS